MAVQIQTQSLDAEKLDLLKKTICIGATDSEMELFAHQCNRMGLDPFSRQIYFIKAGGKMTVMTSIDGYRIIAERTGRYMPGREPTFHHDAKGNLISATSYVKKFGPDKQWHEIGATAYFREFSKGNMWDKMPYVMLAKVAESMALRRAFPADLSGLYTKEEMEQASEGFDASGSMIGEAQKQHPEIEFISQQDADYIEACLHPQDKKYKEDLLAYFSTKYNLGTIDSFTKVPKRCKEDIFRSIKRRYEVLAEQQKQVK